MVVKIEVKGVKELMKKLDKKSMKILKNVDTSIQKSAEFLAGEVKESIAGRRAEPISVDTGNFLRKVEHKKIGMLQAEVSDGSGYGIHLEYGTSRIPARKHFRNSTARNRKKIVDFVNKAVIQS